MRAAAWPRSCTTSRRSRDRKSTRLNSSHVEISYAVFCLKKKKKKEKIGSSEWRGKAECSDIRKSLDRVDACMQAPVVTEEEWGWWQKTCMVSLVREPCDL